MRLLFRARNGVFAVDGAAMTPPEGRFDLTIDAPDADLLPGLINGHDHLHRNHYGRLGRPPYANAYEWAHDIQDRDAARIAAGRALPRRDALLHGAWKNLFAGVTAVVHHDAWEADFDHGFPLHVVRIAQADSLGMSDDIVRLDPTRRFGLHVAEGVDAGAAEEVRTLARAGLLSDRLVGVHGVGMDADAVARFRLAGASLVWCPSSNLFLFDRTAPPALLAPGIDIVLGSDSLLTGAGNLLDEVRFARSLDLLDDARLADAVGATAARVFGLAPPTLAIGTAADLILLGKPLLEATADDVMLTMVAGAPQFVDGRRFPDLAAHLPDARRRTFGEVTRWTSDMR